ncbi:MBL fold metallo-hydrolase, partial [Halobium palmae]
IDRPSERAREIVDHHEERAWRVLDAVRRLGPCDTWTVSHDLFGGLDGIHVLHGPGEAYAHLEHLERAGTVVRNGIEYRLADGAAERLSAQTEERWSL